MATDTFTAFLDLLGVKYIKFRTFALFLPVAALLSCYFSSNSEVKKIPDEIVLIFQKDTLKTNNIHRGYYLYYFDTTSMSREEIISTASDTVVISTNNNMLEISCNLKDLNYEPFDYATYLFQRGDSVLFTFKDNLPYVTVLNRETSFYENNFDVFIRENVTKDTIPSVNFFTNPYGGAYLLQTYFPDIDEIRKIKTQNRNNAIIELVGEYIIADSLYGVGLLSKTGFDYRLSKLVNNANILCIYNPSILPNPEIEKILSDTVLFSIYSDSLIQFAFYRDNFVRYGSYTKEIKSVVNSNSTYPNYFARFDTISRLDLMSDKIKHYFLTGELRNIVGVGNRNEIEQYSKKYTSITGDSLFVNKLLSKEKIEFSDGDDLLLTDGNYNIKSFQEVLNRNNDTSLHEVLERNRGKVIYLDFWASWCAPCKASMPDAKKLREEYKDKDVTFIYLALNDNEFQWKKTEQGLEVNYLSESYFIKTNSKVSRFLADIQLRSIPRYLIYNKKGEIVNLNAPGPKGKEIRQQLDMFLKE